MYSDSVGRERSCGKKGQLISTVGVRDRAETSDLDMIMSSGFQKAHLEQMEELGRDDESL